MKALSDTLIVVAIDVDEEQEAEFNRWHQEVGIPRLLESPGYLSAVRCRAVVGEPRFTTMFEANPSATVKYSFDAESSFAPDSLELAKHVRLNVAVYQQIFPETGVIQGADWREEGTPGAILFNRFNVLPEREEEFNAWYNDEHLPFLAKVPGTISDRRFVALKGKQKYLARYDLTNPDVPTTEEWLKIRYSPWTMRVGRTVKDAWRNVLVPLEDVQLAKPPFGA
jgi:hypothetical protein